MTANPDHATADPRTPSVRVLVAFEDVRALYRHVFASAIRDLRPALTVRVASLGGLTYELGHFDPHVVVSSQPNDEQPNARGAWVHVPTEDGTQDDERLAEICLEGERWRTDALRAARGHRRGAAEAAGGEPFGGLLKAIEHRRGRLAAGRLALEEETQVRFLLPELAF
jgi:hypothetical protein